tara:strand:- start:1835 stop:2110 length:276 start_codon:yes stop_codon:yes gene_type:complete
MPFTKETASKAGRKSKRGKDVLDSELKEKLKLRFLDILESIDKKELTSTEKLKYLQLSINYILPKIYENQTSTGETIKTILFTPSSEFISK